MWHQAVGFRGDNQAPKHGQAGGRCARQAQCETDGPNSGSGRPVESIGRAKGFSVARFSKPPLKSERIENPAAARMEASTVSSASPSGSSNAPARRRQTSIVAAMPKSDMRVAAATVFSKAAVETPSAAAAFSARRPAIKSRLSEGVVAEMVCDDIF